MGRITIDIDGENRDESTFRMLKIYFNLKYVFPDAKIRVDITRKGYHIVAFSEKIQQQNVIEYRKMFGDDSIRIMLDEDREPVGSNILWSVKKGFVVKKDIKVI